jgi:hypothetical protein
MLAVMTSLHRDDATHQWYDAHTHRPAKSMKGSKISGSGGYAFIMSVPVAMPVEKSGTMYELPVNRTTTLLDWQATKLAKAPREDWIAVLDATALVEAIRGSKDVRQKPTQRARDGTVSEVEMRLRAAAAASTVQCTFFDRDLHLRMLLVPTPARLKRAGVLPMAFPSGAAPLTG